MSDIGDEYEETGGTIFDMNFFLDSNHSNISDNFFSSFENVSKLISIVL